MRAVLRRLHCAVLIVLIAAPYLYSGGGEGGGQSRDVASRAARSVTALANATHVVRLKDFAPNLPSGLAAPGFDLVTQTSSTLLDSAHASARVHVQLLDGPLAPRPPPTARC
jgi:hypothetical protein